MKFCKVITRRRRMQQECNKNATMNNVSQKKICNSEMTQVHMEPPPIPLIKGK